MDLEYGRTALLDRWRALKIDKTRVGRTLVCFLLAVVGMTIQVVVQNAKEDVVTGAETVFPIHERQYKAFSFSSGISETPLSVEPFPILNSFVNRELQLRNLVTFSQHVRSWLNSTNTLCIHAKYFNVPYDIILYHNMTLINSDIGSVLDHTKRSSVHVRDVYGKERWVTYPTSLQVRYTTSELTNEDITLYNRQALCLYYYKHF